MAKFRVLKYNQIYMTHLGIYSNHLNKPTNELFRSYFCYYAGFLIVIALLALGGFIVKYFSDVKPALDAFKIFIAAIQCAGMLYGVGFKMIKVKALHLELQRIVDEGISN